MKLETKSINSLCGSHTRIIQITSLYLTKSYCSKPVTLGSLVLPMYWFDLTCFAHLTFVPVLILILKLLLFLRFPDHSKGILINIAKVHFYNIKNSNNSQGCVQIVKKVFFKAPQWTCVLLRCPNMPTTAYDSQLEAAK